MSRYFDCLIIGAGPCGIGAALELKKAGVDVAVIDKGMPGGKVNIAPRVDNYPGFKEIPGPNLAMEFYKRMINANIELIPDTINSLQKYDENFELEGNEDEYAAKCVLIATGTSERKAGLAKEDELLGHGLSYCALCDGHFFKNKKVVVIGGGNSALKEAIHLSHVASELTLIHRRNEFRGSISLVEELKKQPNVTILTPYIPLEIIGDDKVEGLKIQNKETLEEKILLCDGLFPLVGQIPNTQFIKIEGVLNEYNLIPVERNMMTKVDGLFAGGDVLPREIRQIYLSEHDGKVAAKSIIEYLKR